MYLVVTASSFCCCHHWQQHSSPSFCVPSKASLQFCDLAMRRHHTAGSVNRSCCVGITDIIKNWSDEFWQDRISPINGRSGKVNRIHWNNHCSPATNNEPWLPEEEAKLLEIANQHSHLNVSLMLQHCIQLFSWVWGGGGGGGKG